MEFVRLMPEKVRASPAGTPGYPQRRQAALDLLLPDPDEEPPDEDPPDEDPPDEDPPDEDPPEELLPDDEEDEEPESDDELPADDPVEAPDSLLAGTVLVEEERLSFR
jgi:hypothetical protein